MSDTKDLTLLGNQNTKYSYDKPSANILETFDNQHIWVDYLTPFDCTEFTSLCPKTWQPDFAHIHIMYVPNEKMIESKSLKLYLFSFRNSWEFHEDIANRIAKDVISKINPKYLLVYGDFTVRGGIGIKPIVEHCTHKENIKDYRFKVDLYFKMNK